MQLRGKTGKNSSCELEPVLEVRQQGRGGGEQGEDEGGVSQKAANWVDLG